MIKDKLFTSEQIKEVEEVAKKMNIFEIALYFKLNIESFKRIRKAQPELESALQRGLQHRDDKIFTEEELLEVEELAKTNNADNVSKHFNIKLHHFAALKRSQPELAKAYQRGVKQRRYGAFHVGRRTNTTKLDQLSKLIKITETTLNMSLKDICPQQALSKYKEMKKVEKECRLYQELREMRDAGL